MGMLTALVSAKAVLPRHVNAMTPKRQAAQERLKELKKWQSALCLCEKVLIPACVSMWLDLIKIFGLSDGFPFYKGNEGVRAARDTQHG